jgi:hypothetical protein
MSRMKWFLTTISGALGRMTLIAVLAGVPGGLLFLRYHGFGDAIQNRFAEVLSQGEVRVVIGKLTFNPFEGVVARDVEIYRTTDGEERLAEINRVAVAPNFGALFQGRVQIDELDLRQSRLSIPLSGPGDEAGVAVLENVNAEVHCPPDQVRITRAEFEFEGIRVSLNGLLQNPHAFAIRPPREAEKNNAQQKIVRSLLRELEAVRFKGERPELSASFRGDLASPQSFEVDHFQFRSGPFEVRGARIEGLKIDGKFADGRLSLTRGVVTEPGGALRVRGEWDTVSGEVDLDAAGGVDPALVMLLAKRGEWMREFRTKAAPKISATAQLNVKTSPMQVKVIGRAGMGPFALKGVEFDSMAADFAWQDGRLFTRDLDIRLNGGRILADLLMEPGAVRMRLSSDVVPTGVAPLLDKKAQELLAMMEFKDAPKVQVEVEGSRLDFAVIRGRGTIELGRTAMRGSWIDSAHSALEFGDRAVTYRDFTVAAGRQKGTGSFTYDFGRREVRLEKVRSTLTPHDVMLWIDPRIAATIKAYRFRGPPLVLADGMVHMADPAMNRLKLTVDAAQGLDYELIGKDLPFDDTKAIVDLRGRQVMVEVSKATLYGGSITATASVPIDPSEKTFSTEVTADRVNFAALTRLYFGYDSSKGVMSGRYAMKAQLGDERNMTGDGSIRVEDGNVLAIPIFGPLSEVVNKILPGVGYESARLGRADFTIANQKVATQNLEIDGSGFTMFGAGGIAFLTGEMDLTVRINARGVPGLVLFPVSKLFEYVATGTVSDPRWRPKLIPKEFMAILDPPKGDGARKSSRPHKR